jgi:deoxyhypusine synthase
MKGQNRIGNVLVPNNNYCAFEDFMKPVLTEMLTEQDEGGVSWTPSKMIQRLGERINDESSVYYWCAYLQPYLAIYYTCHALLRGTELITCRAHSSQAWAINGGLQFDLQRMCMVSRLVPSAHSV